MATLLKDLTRDYNVDFISLQETVKKSYTDKFFKSIEPDRAFAWQWIPAESKSGGVLCGIKSEKFDTISCEIGSHAILAKVVDKKTFKKMSLISVYGPVHDDKKEEFLTELSCVCSDNSYLLVIGGDFNTLRYSSEKNKPFRGN